MLRTLLSAAALAAIASSASANLIITEVMSSSGTGGTNDWFEVTNTGASSIDITGYKMDDSSGNSANAVALNGVASIAPGQSVVFIENTSDAATTISDFRTFWGTPAASIVIGSYNGSGAGVSLSSGGDAVNLFDSSNTVVANVSFAAATAGTTFDNFAGINNAAISTLSAVGVNGAYTSSNSLGNVGSPGVIPEPTTLGLLGVAGLALGRRRRS